MRVAPGQDVSTFPQAEVLSPANRFLVDWVMHSKAPPPGQSLVIENGDIARDPLGIAKGGVRSPWVDIPKTRYIASIPPQGTLYGLEEPFAADRLRQLYGSCTAWLAEFEKQAADMVATGWMFADDAKKLTDEEAALCDFDPD